MCSDICMDGGGRGGGGSTRDLYGIAIIYFIIQVIDMSYDVRFSTLKYFKCIELHCIRGTSF